MKTIKLILFATVATIAMLAASCSKNDDTTALSSTSPINNAQYKIMITTTVLTNGCNTLSSPYIVNTQYISDGNIAKTIDYSGNSQLQIINEEVLSGNIIGIKLKLPAFNSSNPNSGKGISVSYLTVKIINNQTGEVLLDRSSNQTFGLFICTNTVYEGTLLYNTQTNTYSITKGEWNF